VYFGTAGAAVFMVDAETGAYRESTLADLYDIARVVDALEHVHFFQRSIVARDMIEPADLDLNTCYACVAGTAKHVGTSFTQPRHVEDALAMLHLIAGGEAAWRARPFVSMSSCFVVPPLKCAEDACRCLEVGVRGGMPVLLLPAGQAGATRPAALAGAVVQEVAEALAGLVYVNAIVPGAPAIFGPWPFVSDLRTGAMSGGSGEQALLMAACAQMGHFYDLTVGVASGMTDAKVPDAQAGYEKGYNHALVGNAGANLIYESAGMHASLLGFCLESLVIDNDAIGATLRTIRGIEVNDETLSIDVIREACIGGPGHFLGHPQTLARMQSDYLYPLVGDRTSPKEWAEQGSTDVVQRARRKTEEILAGHFPRHLSAETDDAIRARLPIKLPRERMHPTA
jgi:trimethylamine--corrinoid protein Co-methyltransferase